jgi:SPP1 family predicted phage head-tail adaptor
MRAGSLRHLVSIESYTETRDSFGGVSNTWAEFSKAYANIVPLSGKEKYVSAEKYATSTHQITIRYLDGVDPKMRVVYGTRMFEIVSVINTGERDKMMQLIVEEDVDND